MHTRAQHRCLETIQTLVAKMEGAEDGGSCSAQRGRVCWSQVQCGVCIWEPVDGGRFKISQVQTCIYRVELLGGQKSKIGEQVGISLPQVVIDYNEARPQYLQQQSYLRCIIFGVSCTVDPAHGGFSPLHQPTIRHQFAWPASVT